MKFGKVIVDITQKQLESLDQEVSSHIKDIFILSEDFPNDTDIYVKLTKGFHWIFIEPYLFINSGFYQKKSNVDKDTMKSSKFIKNGEELLSNYERYEKFKKSLI